MMKQGKAKFAICVCFALSAMQAHAEFQLRDITDAVGQVKKVLPGGSTSKSNTTYIPPGMDITLENGKSAKAYGYDCQPGERQPCGSIKVTNGSHKVMIVPVGGKSFEEKWTFRRVSGSNIVAVRPDGTILEASMD